MPATATKPSKFEREVQKIVNLLLDSQADALGVARDLNDLIDGNDDADAQIVREALRRTGKLAAK